MKKLVNLIIILLVVFSLSVETRMFISGMVQIPNLPESIGGRLNYYYSYFTILSNITIGISSFILFFNPQYDRPWFRILRLDGLVCILITCIVYNLVLRNGHNPPGTMKYTNEFLHVIIPFLAVLYWILFGPRKKIDNKTLVQAVIPPLLYVFYIFIRGEITHLYPYFFLDAGQIGYPQALINTGGVVIIFFIFEFMLWLIDKLLSRKL